MYDRKNAARPFDTIHDILRSLSLVNSLLKGRNAPIWRKRVPTHMRLSVTDGLNGLNAFLISCPIFQVPFFRESIFPTHLEEQEIFVKNADFSQIRPSFADFSRMVVFEDPFFGFPLRVPDYGLLGTSARSPLAVCSNFFAELELSRI